jgi:murein DD-endopeptidase MepM/ murein hydrolase activator NlpD
MSVLTYFTGMLISAAIAGDFPDPGKAALSWGKGLGFSYLSFIGLWFVFADGATDGGKRGYTPDGGRGTQVAFNGYPSPATSPYLLPFAGSAECIQGNSGFWSHNSVANQVFSYDFSLNLGQDVLCMRDGTVAGVPLDSVDDGDHPSDGNHLIVKHVPDATNDRGIGGASVVTYAKYYHGQKGSIAAAFGGTLPAVGSAIKQGQLLMKANSTGNSRCNHVHVQISPDNGSGAPDGYTIPFVFKDISDPGVAKSKKVYDSQNVKKP